MKMMRKLRILVSVAALAVMVSIGLPKASAQIGCLDECLSRYADCVNNPGPQNCDDLYLACLMACVSQ